MGVAGGQTAADSQNVVCGNSASATVASLTGSHPDELLITIDDDHVVIVHCGSSVPACSATIYAAYQAGQFSSRCPVRFS
jgi:hypothetical protein